MLNLKFICLLIILGHQRVSLDNIIELSQKEAEILENQEENIILETQDSVYSDKKEFALFYTIFLSSKSIKHNMTKILKSAAHLENFVESILPECMQSKCNESIEIWAGIGFSEKLYNLIYVDSFKDFPYVARQGNLGNLPATGGDLFVHAKCNNYGKLFELAEKLASEFESVASGAVEVYGFTYRNGRDITGFIDGTANPRGEDERRRVAVEPETGGSYALTQRWIHNLTAIKEMKASAKEAIIGRTLPEGDELPNKSSSSHVARTRMAGGTNLAEPAFEIVRQSMPYGTVHGEAGLFFIAYAASVANFDFMLDRMVGATDGVPDDLMRLTRCVTGNYWYFPGKEELRLLA